VVRSSDRSGDMSVDAAGKRMRVLKWFALDPQGAYLLTVYSSHR
jgi:hypothetical protein